MTRTRSTGFTLVELLVVIVIIAVLAALSFGVYRGILEKGRGVQALAQFRDVSAGLEGFIGDNQKPPLPAAARASGTDTTYGVPDGDNKTDFLLAALMPNDTRTKDFYAGVKDVNPRAETYLSLPFNQNKVNGMGEDGRLYDPWGKELMVAVNAPPYTSDTPANGIRDKALVTGGAAEYSDTKPREQDYVIWTYGKDGKKGKEGASPTAQVPMAGSDDLATFK